MNCLFVEILSQCVWTVVDHRPLKIQKWIARMRATPEEGGGRSWNVFINISKGQRSIIFDFQCISWLCGLGIFDMIKRLKNPVLLDH